MKATLFPVSSPCGLKERPCEQAWSEKWPIVKVVAAMMMRITYQVNIFEILSSLNCNRATAVPITQTFS